MTLRTRAEKVLAGGPGTFSKHWGRYAQGVGPFALVSGEGCYVTGDDGKSYLDTVAALGPVLLGYGHPDVTEAVQKQVTHGGSFSMVHPLEIEVAELLSFMLPCADMVRFCRNGTDATHMAVRLARALHGHKHVIFAGYHGGGGDSFGITTTKNAGIFPHLHPFNHQVTWETFDTVPKHAWDDLACIITEVPALPWGTPDTVYREKLLAIQEMAYAHDALFVIDEVVTFPRCDIGGAQRYYGVVPDLACVSKGIANGLPLAALVGKRCYMERLNAGDIFASYTFAGETTALAAAQVTLWLVRWHDALQHIHQYGEQLGDELREIFRDYPIPATVYGHPWRIAVKWNDVADNATAAELRTLWIAEHAKRGILHGIGVIFPMACWGDLEVSSLITAAHEVSYIIQKAITQKRVQYLLPCPVIDDVLTVRV